MKQSDLNITADLRRKFQARLDRACAADNGTGMTITKEIGDIGREVGVQKLCRIAQLERTSFYRTFDGKTDPRLSNMMRALRALGLTLTLR